MVAEALIGGTYGRLTVTGTTQKGRKTLCACTCACGRPATAEPGHLRSGRRVSCGCAMGGDRRSVRYRASRNTNYDIKSSNNAKLLIANQRNLRFGHAF